MRVERAANPMQPTPIKSVLDDIALTGTTLAVAGWVRTFRNDCFIALNDGSTIRNLPCVIDPEQAAPSAPSWHGRRSWH
ncbi:MAG: hypothetical protein QY325_13455 [Flavobacteriales bacterium]|jgi:asparaginyl-tRNA synthetase|nr:MAG: hypothetical protein QY325_13455 [Flavobacteriales bacterium]